MGGGFERWKGGREERRWEESISRRVLEEGSYESSWE